MLGSLIKWFKLEILQKSEVVASVGSTLRSHINKKLSYLDNNRSGFLPVLFKYFDIKDFLGLYEQERTHFFSQIDLDKNSFYCNFSSY